MSVLSELFQDIADAIRSKTGGEESMSPAEFPDEIRSITGGGSDVYPNAEEHEF